MSGARVRITRTIKDDELARTIEPSMLRLGGALGRRMQRLVPKRTFRLHDSIRPPETTRNGARVKVVVRFGGKTVRGKYVGYHLHVERGTSKMRAQPYARPALLQTRSSDLRSTETMTTRGAE